MIISLFETVRLSVSISPRNLYNSLKSIKEIETEPHFPHTDYQNLPLNNNDSKLVIRHVLGTNVYAKFDLNPLKVHAVKLYTCSYRAQRPNFLIFNPICRF